MEQHFAEERYHSFTVSSSLLHYFPFILYSISNFLVALISLYLFTVYRCEFPLRIYHCFLISSSLSWSPILTLRLHLSCSYDNIKSLACKCISLSPRTYHSLFSHTISAPFTRTEHLPYSSVNIKNPHYKLFSTSPTKHSTSFLFQSPILSVNSPLFHIPHTLCIYQSSSTNCSQLPPNIS